MGEATIRGRDPRQLSSPLLCYTENKFLALKRAPSGIAKSPATLFASVVARPRPYLVLKPLRFFTDDLLFSPSPSSQRLAPAVVEEDEEEEEDQPEVVVDSLRGRKRNLGT